MSKYNRTYHFPFSPEIHSDDKTMKNPESLIGKKIVITEKLDGGNACLKNGKVFARTHSVEATHGSFSILKQINDFLLAQNKLDSSLEIFGENMQGVHSIDYRELSSPFYIFNIRKNDIWLSWEEVRKISQQLKLPTVPEIFIGTFDTLKELELYLKNRIQQPSLIHKNAECEGFVVRLYDSFKEEDFSDSIGKFVRSGHVQTDDHWSNNWREAKISKSFYENFYK